MNKGIWNQVRLEQLIQVHAEESINLEFKDGKALGMADPQKLAIAKSISALANSDGGTIIYGMTEIDHKASSLSPVDGNLLTKEWLENIITSNIHRRIEELIIHPVRLGNKTERTVYVIEVPVSYNAPHMVHAIFYKRYNFKAVPMEEYEVRLLYGRKQKVILENSQVHVAITNRETLEEDKFYLFSVHYHLRNIGTQVAENYRLRCELQKFLTLKYTFPTGKDYGFLVRDTNVFVSPKTAVVLFPEEDMSALHFTFKIPVDEPHLLKDLSFKAKLYTENGNSDFTHEVGKTCLGLIDRLKLMIEEAKSNKMKAS